MNFKQFSATNRERCESPEGFNHPFNAWSIAEWTNAIAGEVGEACNDSKKIIRLRDGIRGNIKPGDKTADELRAKCAKELCDVMIYADLAMQVLGFDTETMLKMVFNAKSDEIGCAIKYVED